MVKGEDRISNLPDEILQSILCLIPLKSAIKTSTLSKRWKHLWQCNLISSSSLQFDHDFSCNQSPKQFVTVLERYLHLHANQNLDKFSILFSPFDLFFPNLERWVRTVLTKGVRVLDVDLSQGVIGSCNNQYFDERDPFELPDSLFDCNNLTHLSLARCDFPDPFNFSNLVGLVFLSLDNVNINDEMLTNILQTCVFIKNLSLKRCGSLEAVKFVGENLNLQKLVMVDCRGVYKIEIYAPNLESFIYYGAVAYTYFIKIPKLDDVYFCSVGLEDYYADVQFYTLVAEVSHVKVLTLCSVCLMFLHLSQVYDIELSFQELQLIMDSLTEDNLYSIFSFLHMWTSPFLEKLFISIPSNMDTPMDIRYYGIDNDVPKISFENLKLIQITNFEGSMLELKLVKFFLENAPVLESLVLVTKEHDNMSKHSLFLRIVQGQLLVFQKASKDARIILCGPSDHDIMINPVHKEIYHENKYRAGTTVHQEYTSVGGEDILLDQQFM